MDEHLLQISFIQLSIIALPVVGVVYMLYRWRLGFREALWAMIRMLLQLFAIGYFLAYIFETKHALTVLAVLLVMLIASAWIALRTVKSMRKRLFSKTLLSIFIGGGITLALVAGGVLQLQPWFQPRFMIPLAGMIFANAMNGVSLSAERLFAQLDQDIDYIKARGVALGAALIPTTNALFAVGLVSIPGMMTGQILSGVSPLIAARYQIMVMLMVYAATGLSSVLFLIIIKTDIEKHNDING